MRLDSSAVVFNGYTTTEQIVRVARKQAPILPTSIIRSRIKRFYRDDPRTKRIGRAVFLPVGMLEDIEAAIWPAMDAAVSSSDSLSSDRQSPMVPPIGKYVIMRGRESGVHAGTLVALDLATKSCTLKDARRIWLWSGAATLSELAVYGAKNVDKCKFGVPVENQNIVGDVCEIIVCQPKGRAMIEGVPEWRT